MVGNSFRLGYRFQRYWDTSMANAFFAAEAGTGLFMVSLYFDFLWGMIAGLAFAGTIKPYFHLAHMGVPSKSMRAILRPDRSWISRGVLALGILIGPGALHILDQAFGLYGMIGLPEWFGLLVKYTAVAGGLVVMCYQGMAMSASQAISLWATPLLPISSFFYSLSCGVILTAAFGWNYLEVGQIAQLVQLGIALLILDGVIVVSILSAAKNKAKGGAFSVEMLMESEYAPWFRNLVFGVGLIVPALLLLFAGSSHVAAMAAALALLVGFYAFRVLIFKAGVFEPITNDLVNSLGL
jgi:formate-dependent nitrite reductase membrane component NrfD